MALDNLSLIYPGQANPPSADYPQGSARNVSAPDSLDGTPWEQQIINDQLGFFQALLAAGGVTPNGTPDTAQNSQYLEALRAALATNQVAAESSLRESTSSTATTNTALVATITPSRVGAVFEATAYVSCAEVETLSSGLSRHLRVGKLQLRNETALTSSPEYRFGEMLGGSEDFQTGDRSGHALTVFYRFTADSLAPQVVRLRFGTASSGCRLTVNAQADTGSLLVVKEVA